MENLDIKGSFTSPTIFFDIENLIFTIEGECRPENVLTFFQPILDWLDDLKVHAAQQNYNSKVLQFNFKIEYFNSSSAKFIFTIFKKIKLLQEFGIKIEVNWNYDELDEDLFETGKELQKILELKFNFIAI
ncbi:MAG: hypothetical protein RLZZ414_911 [Bacteroidota bacterium]|jgi:hypothetical protein